MEKPTTELKLLKYAPKPEREPTPCEEILDDALGGAAELDDVLVLGIWKDDGRVILYTPMSLERLCLLRAVLDAEIHHLLFDDEE